MKKIVYTSMLLVCSFFTNAQITVTSQVNTALNRKAISPLIYGSNESKITNTANPSNITINRMGGNRLTGYNWENNMSNAGSDWNNNTDTWMYYTLGLNAATYQNTAGSGAYLWYDMTRNINADMIFTIQASGYVSGNTAKAVTCNAPCADWIPVFADKPGGVYAYPPNKTDNAVYMDEYLDFLIKKYGTAANGGIKYYQIDNEKDLWHTTHKLIWGNAIATTLQAQTKDITYAKMIKRMDPTANVVGFCSFGVAGWHNDIKIVDYLKGLKTASDTEGKRLLDVCAVNIYPEHQSTANNKVWNNDLIDEATVIARVQAPRSLWDPTFIEKSWVPNALYGGQATMLLRRLQGYINTNYPGTKLGVTEWLYGASNHISGGVATADVLGIYGRENVYMSCYFDNHVSNLFTNTYAATAYRIFRDYDGKGGKFGDISVDATVSNNQYASVYASVQDGDNDNTLHLVVMNKSHNQTQTNTITIQSDKTFESGEIYGFDGTTKTITSRGTITSITNNVITVSLPVFGVYHLVLKASGSSCQSAKLGDDKSLCGTAGITLNSGITALGNKTFTWAKDGVVIPNQNTATLQVTQKGIYKVTVDSLGCISNDEVVVSDELPAIDLGADITICKNLEETLTIPVTGNGYSYLWKKDNVVLNGQTAQTLLVSNPGIYLATVSALNCVSVTDEVTVTSNLLQVINDTICDAGIVSLTVSGGVGPYTWYADAINGNSLFTGQNYTSSITQNTTLYVQDDGVIPEKLGLELQGTATAVNQIWNVGGVDLNGTDKKYKFAVTSAITVKSLAVYPNATGTIVVNFTNTATNNKLTKTFTNVGTGKQVLNIELALPVGNYLVDLYGSTVAVKYQAFGGVFPYEIPNKCSLTYNETWQADRYGFFYDWQIVSGAGSSCVRTPVSGIINANATKCGGVKTQNIQLEQGWNLVSINVEPTDNTLETVFANLDVAVIKNADGFWKNNQNAVLNSIQTIIPAKGYLVYMNTAGTLTVSGTPLNINNLPLTIKTGWNMVGCPYQTVTPFSSEFNATNCQTIKNFDGFWVPNGALNSIQNFEPGKGYYLRK